MKCKSKHYLTSSILCVGVYEFLEEILEILIENLIVTSISLFLLKILTSLIAVTSIHATMFGIKRFVAKFTYKKGNDKMSKIKKFFKWIYSNKKTLLGTVSALATSVGCAYATYGGYFDFLPTLYIGSFDAMTVIVGLVCFVLAELGVTGKGFESIQTFGERVKKLAEEKHKNDILKLAKKELKAEEKAKAKKVEQAEKERLKAEEQVKLAQKQAQEEREKARLKAEIEEAKLLINK